MKQKKQRRQRPPSPAPIAKTQPDPRMETIARALAAAISPASRAQARAAIQECGSTLIAASEVFLDYAEAAEQTDPRYTIACHAGCWFCCTLPVGVTVFEAAMVRSVILTLPEAEQAAIWERLQAHVTAQRTALATASQQRSVFRHRCPLLNSAGACSVYEGRPLACRSVLSLDAERCRRVFLEGDGGDPTIPYSLTNNAALTGVPQLMITLNEGNLDHYPSYELGAALYTLWSRPETFNAWQQGARFAEHGFPYMAEDGEIFPTPEDLPLGPPQ